jgi:hypothetical protein
MTVRPGLARTESPIGFLEIATKLRSLAVATLAGVLSGTVALGVGCRLAMRIVAMLASDADQGSLTDAAAVVGDVSIGGTMFLALLGGAVGTIGGQLYLAVHRRLVWAGRWRGVAYGALLLAIFGSVLIQSDNPDFERFGIPIVNVVLFAALFVAFGILLAPVYDNLQRVVSTPSRTITGYALFAAQAAGTLLSLFPILFVVAFMVDTLGDTGFVALGLLALFCYMLVALPAVSVLRALRPRLPSTGAPRAIAAILPLAPPVAFGLALDVHELLAIF